MDTLTRRPIRIRVQRRSACERILDALGRRTVTSLQLVAETGLRRRRVQRALVDLESSLLVARNEHWTRDGGRVTTWAVVPPKPLTPSRRPE